MSDAQFRNLVRKASISKAPEDIEIAANYGKRIGLSDWDLLDSLPYPTMAEKIAIKSSPAREWGISLYELQQIGVVIDPNDPNIDEHGYYPTRNIAYPPISETWSVEDYWDKSVQYVVLENGIVLKTVGFGRGEIETDQKIIDELFKLIKQSSAIKRARDILVSNVSKNDPILRQILLMHIEYNHGHISEPDIINGIPIWMVGSNASCQFGLGTVGAQLYRYSWCDGDAEPRIQPVQDFSGYLGHLRKNPEINWQKAHRHWKSLRSTLNILNLFQQTNQLDRKSGGSEPITRSEMGIPRRKSHKEESEFDLEHGYLEPEQQEKEQLEDVIDVLINLGQGTGMSSDDIDDANHSIVGMYNFIKNNDENWKSFLEKVRTDEKSLERELFECFCSYVDVLQELLGRSRAKAIRSLARELQSNRQALETTLQLDPDRPGAAFDYWPSDEIIKIFFGETGPPAGSARSNPFQNQLKIEIFKNKQQSSPSIQSNISKIEITYPKNDQTFDSWHKRKISILNQDDEIISDLEMPYQMIVNSDNGAVINVENINDFEYHSQQGFILKYAGDGNFFISDLAKERGEFILHIGANGALNTPTPRKYGWETLIIKPFVPSCAACARLLPYKKKCRKHCAE